MIINFTLFIFLIAITNYMLFYFIIKIREHINWIRLLLILPFVFAFIDIIGKEYFRINTYILTPFTILYIQILYMAYRFPPSRKMIISHLFVYICVLTYSIIEYYMKVINNIEYVIAPSNITYILRCLLFILYAILIYTNKESKEKDEVDYKINWLLRQASIIFIIANILRVFAIMKNNYGDIGKIIVTSFITTYIIFIKLYFLVKEKKNRAKESLISLIKENEDNIAKLEYEIIIDKINIYFLETDSYLQSGYNLSNLSKDLEIPKKQISKALKYLNTNFYNLLADYRINYAKIVILKNDSYTIESLANQCGFNSKTSFNFYFKKATTKTPSEYRRIYSKK